MKKKEQPAYQWQDKEVEKKMDTFRMSQHGQILVIHWLQ